MADPFVLTVSDFSSGKTKLSVNSVSLDSLKSDISDAESKWIRQLIGDNLFSQFKNDISGGIPQHPKFLALWNGGFTFTAYCDDDETIYFDGLKKALIPLVYCEVAKYSNGYATNAGTVIPQNENSGTMTGNQLSRWLKNIENSAVKLSQDVWEFIRKFQDYSSIASSISLNAGIVYDVLISDTKYLKDGDSVTINGVSYEISSLVDDTSFQIESATDISGTNIQVDWDIFGEFDSSIVKKKQYNWP